ncbi:arylsulfatase [Lewinella lacunae]|uniref:Arylsulfatase n=2 Tax=Neolewinella lacunae TaxID=1517758 RepID=A0A923PPD8_9BACT|nr:arylsulfatase [Neolewinella lacunae]
MLFVGCGEGSSFSSQGKQAAGAQPPNIVLIVVDDLGYGDLGCFGQQILQTHHIDRLAQGGMRFTQHYAGSTVCAPSRASLLTGKHPGHVSVRGNQPAPQLLKDEEVTIAEALGKAGYTSAVVGKWGVGHPPAPDDPARNGFDHAYGYINMWHAHNFYPEFLYENAEKVALAGNVNDDGYDFSKQHPQGLPEGTGVAREKGTYVLGEFEKQALGFIEDNKDKPFFLYLALNMPHTNNEAGYVLGDGQEVPMVQMDGKLVADYGTYGEHDWPNPEKGFATMITLLDQTVGLVEQRLAELGLTENTMVVFVSDNGPHQEGGHRVDFFDSNGPLRGSKRDLYEGGIRVPMIVKYPGKVAAGSTSDMPCASWDFLPTFCELAGTEVPAGVDGISFLPTLTGKADEQRKHRWLYWEFYEQGGKQALREGDWKYVKLNVRDPEQPITQELYDLSKDLGETQNLIMDYPGVAARMDSILGTEHVPIEGVSLFAMERDAETAF